jgi:hypothetical protein
MRDADGTGVFGGGIGPDPAISSAWRIDRHATSASASFIRLVNQRYRGRTAEPE